MNQDQVKELLVKLEPRTTEFAVLFSGKKSKLVNGLYKPASREILIHNRNFNSDNDLVYTAIHEYAHHLVSTAAGGKISARAHTIEFWATFHNLLDKAEKAKLYSNPLQTKAFAETTAALAGLVAESGRIMIEIGKQLIEAQRLCKEHGARFDDYVMRQLRLPMPWAKAAMKAAHMQLDPALGAENLKTVAAIGNDEERGAVAAALIKGDESPQQIKTARKRDTEPEDPAERLKKELERITRTIGSLTKRAEETRKAIEALGEGKGPS